MTSGTSPFTNPFAGFNADAIKCYLPQSDTMNALARGAMEASTASTRASVKGMQEAGQSLMSQMKEQFTLSVETGKKWAEVTTLEEAMKVQTGFIKSAFEANLKGVSQLTELYTDTMREAFAPLAKQAKMATKTTDAV